MPIIVILTSPDGPILQAGVLDDSGVTISNNTVTRDLPVGVHLFRHTIEGPVGASCGIKITQADATLTSVSAPSHTIVQGASDDSIPVFFTVQ